MTPSLIAHMPKRDGRPSEDRAWADGNAAVVADGVTRTPHPSRGYPDPSPAAIAAQATVDAVVERLQGGGRPRDALVTANERVARINESLDLPPDVDDGPVDLAGAVAAVAVLAERVVSWAYIGDCGIAHVSAAAGLLATTPDDIEPLRHAFPPISEPGHIRMPAIRARFRNDPTGRGFGVLTGEPAALRYVRSGTWPCVPGATVAVFSDGARPMLRDDHLLRLVSDASVDGDVVTRQLRALADTHDVNDEASLSIVRKEHE